MKRGAPGSKGKMFLKMKGKTNNLKNIYFFKYYVQRREYLDPQETLNNNSRNKFFLQSCAKV